MLFTCAKPIPCAAQHYCSVVCVIYFWLSTLYTGLCVCARACVIIIPCISHTIAAVTLSPYFMITETKLFFRQWRNWELQPRQLPGEHPDAAQEKDWCYMSVIDEVVLVVNVNSLLTSSH